MQFPAKLSVPGSPVPVALAEPAVVWMRGRSELAGSYSTSSATPPRFSAVHASLRSEKGSRRKMTDKTKVKTELDEESSVLVDTEVPVPHDWW